MNRTPRIIKVFPIGLLLSFLFVACSVDHPRVFLPYSELKSPRGSLSKYHIYEMSALENKPLDDYEKRRLREIYSLVLKEQKQGTPYFLEVTAKKETLEKEIGPFADFGEEEGPSLSTEKPALFENAKLKSQYTLALRAWNNDDYVKALNLAEDLLSKASGDEEKITVRFLRLRLYLEIKNWDLAKQEYLSLVELGECQDKVQEAAFLLSAALMGEKKRSEAQQIWSKLCADSKTQTSIRFRYWDSRIRNEGRAPSNAEESVNDPLLSYYRILTDLNSDNSVFFTQPQPSFSPTVRVSSRSHDRLNEVEILLTKKLYADAYELLRQVEKTIGPEDFETKEYVAELYFASGHFFKAFKLLADLWGKQVEQQAAFSFFDYQRMYPSFYNNWLQLLSELWEVDKDFLTALIRQESGFNPNAISSSGARGLMQLMPFLAKSLSQKLGFTWYQEKGLYYPKENTKFGAYHVKQLDLIYGHPALIAASYNAGSARVSRWLEKWGNYPLDVFVELIPIEETKNYVKIVLRNWVCYKVLDTQKPFPKSAIPFDLRKKAIPFAKTKVKKSPHRL